MAAKGSHLKKEIMGKILEIFPDSFLYNDGKEVRINGIEDGVQLQIKVTFTTAKTPVENEEGGTPLIKSSKDEEINFEDSPQEKVPQEPTEEEKERLAMLLDKLGMI